MDEPLTFETDFDAPAGQCQRLSPLVRRVVAGNGGPMTFTGTCTYLVGAGQGGVAVIDPGPDDPAHVEALLEALSGDPVTAILVTHTHRDHSPAAILLARATGAPVIGCAPHRAARPLAAGEVNRMEGAGDTSYAPSRILAEGENVAGQWTGSWRRWHARDYRPNAPRLPLASRRRRAVFRRISRQWPGRSIPSFGPPDRNMAHYNGLAGEETARGVVSAIYWPGLEVPVCEPTVLCAALMAHRGRARKGDPPRPYFSAAGRCRHLSIPIRNVYPALGLALQWWRRAQCPCGYD